METTISVAVIIKLSDPRLAGPQSAGGIGVDNTLVMHSLSQFTSTEVVSSVCMVRIKTTSVDSLQGWLSSGGSPQDRRCHQ
jgi:hypothetical protein